jgi:ribosome-associated toxin RatA of RatAB toxin-antitoxin module
MKRALTINATFSGLSGILLIIFRQHWMTLFEVDYTTPFLVVGSLLIFFSFTILYEIKRQNAFAILWIITQDVLWVIGSIWLLIFNPFDFSRGGNYMIAVVMLIVLFMALNQTSALAQVDSVQGKKIKYFNFTRAVAASKSDVWKVISDVANYHKVAPNVDDVKIISGEGQGMIRSCSHGKDNWTETCSAWQEEKAYSFIVNTTAPDYPYPFKYLKGTWEVEEIDFTHTTIKMHFEFEYKKKFQNVLVHPLLRGKFKKVAEELLDNWQKLLEKK